MFLLEGRANGGIATEDTNTTERRKRETLRRGRKMAGNPPPMVGNTHPKCLNAPIYYQTPNHFFSTSLSKSLSLLFFYHTVLYLAVHVYFWEPSTVFIPTLTGLASDNKQKPWQSTIDGIFHHTFNWYKNSLQIVVKLTWLAGLWCQWPWTLNAVRMPLNLFSLNIHKKQNLLGNE